MDKKNTLLLTVIAIATLLVAVVGATFAYFTAQNGNAATANVDVKTSTVDTATMSTFDDLSINATLDNFGKNDGSLTASTEGYVSFTASDADERGSAKYCYTAEINISTNDFIYSLPKTKNTNTHYPELVLNIWKESNSENNTMEGIDTGDTNSYNQTMYFDTNNHQLFYDNNVLSSGKICTDNTDAESDSDGQKCKDLSEETKIQGFDITVIGNSEYKGGDVPSYSEKTIKIPKKDSVNGETLNDKDFIHEITATGGKEPKPVYDKWKVSVTLVNYKDTDIAGNDLGDQSKYDFENSQNIGNAGRTFKATLNFKPTTCSTD